MNIYGKLQKVRVELHATEMKKTGLNNGKPFFELGDFLPHAIILLDKYGLCGVVSFSPELATLTIYDTETECQPVVITSPFGSAELKGCHAVQNIGAVETYQRRYLWMTALDIIEHDGIDASDFEEFDAAPYIANMEAATTAEALNAAFDALKATGKLDKSMLKAATEKREELAKQLPMTDDRFKKAVAAFNAGKVTKLELLEYKLTDAQREQVAAL